MRTPHRDPRSTAPRPRAHPLGGLRTALPPGWLAAALAPLLVAGCTDNVTANCPPLAHPEVLTVAAASGQPVRGAALLAVYAAGMTAPLFALAAVWDRLRIGQRRWLRGTGVRVGPLRLHTHSVISGLLFAGLGVVFLRYQGTAGLTGLLSPPSLAGWDNRLQDAVTAVQAHVPDLALIAAAAAVVIAVTAWRLRRARRAALADPLPSAGQPAPATPGESQPADRESATGGPAGRDPVSGR